MSTLVTTYDPNAKPLSVADVIVVIFIFLILVLYYLIFSLMKVKKPEIKKISGLVLAIINLNLLLIN